MELEETLPLDYLSANKFNRSNKFLMDTPNVAIEVEKDLDMKCVEDTPSQLFTSAFKDQDTRFKANRRYQEEMASEEN